MLLQGTECLTAVVDDDGLGILTTTSDDAETTLLDDESKQSSPIRVQSIRGEIRYLIDSGFFCPDKQRANESFNA
jgi:hypothetical protein